MRRCAGYTYMTILFVVAIMTAGLGFIGEMWQTAAIREREAELLHVGDQYRKAIERYVRAGGIYPKDLAELLQDRRKPGIERYLRQLYPDPLTGKAEWGLVKAPDGGIMGVHSLSGERPRKAANFRPPDREFAAATQYSDWKFVFQTTPLPALAPPTPK